MGWSEGIDEVSSTWSCQEKYPKRKYTGGESWKGNQTVVRQRRWNKNIPNSTKTKHTVWPDYRVGALWGAADEAAKWGCGQIGSCLEWQAEDSRLYLVDSREVLRILSRGTWPDLHFRKSPLAALCNDHPRGGTPWEAGIIGRQLQWGWSSKHGFEIHKRGQIHWAQWPVGCEEWGRWKNHTLLIWELDG